MNASVARGAVLVVVAALLGFLILRGAADGSQIPVSSGPIAVPTVVANTTSEPVPIETPTLVVVTEDAREPNQVRVLVANGTDVPGQASRLTSALRNQGFLTQEPRNSNSQATSTIYYRPSYAAEATVVRDVLSTSTPIAPMPVPDPFIGEGIDLGNIDVLVLVGADELSTS